MNILVLLPSLVDLLGGMEAFSRAFVKALDEIAEEDGHRVTVLALRDTGLNPLADRYLTRRRTSYHGFSENRFHFSATAMLHARKADVCFVGSVNFMRIVRLLGPARKFLIVYGTEVWERVPHLNKRSFDCLTGVLAISDFTRRQMVGCNPVSEDIIQVFPCTLDPYYEEHVQRSRSLPPVALPKGKLLLSVSRLNDDRDTCRKNIHVVIQAMPQILARVPDAYYVVVGEGGGRAKLQQMARDCGVAGHVVFTGRVSDDFLPQYYAACDTFILPSTQEGFGIVFLEAMYSAKACIGARSGGIPEVIQDRRTGLLFDPNDPGSLAEAAIELLENEPLRLAMGGAGRERLNANFKFEHFRGRLQKILRAAGLGAEPDQIAFGVGVQA